MQPENRRRFLEIGAAAFCALQVSTRGVLAENLGERAETDMASDKVLQALLDSNAEAKTLLSTALAMLIFPKVTETGLAGIGGKRVKGVL